MSALLLEAKDSLLLVVDVQVKLWNHIVNKDQIRRTCRILMQGAHALEVPLLISEQYPKGLGPTLPELRQYSSEGTVPCEKLAFSCVADEPILEKLNESSRRQLILCGIEAHVCVMQTALEALEKGFQVAVVADAIGSREEGNRNLAIDRMRTAGAMIVTTEMVLFEWLRTASHPEFKTVSALVK